MNKHITERKTPLDQWIFSKINSGSVNNYKDSLSVYHLNKIRETIKLASEKSIFYRNHLKGYFYQNILSYEDFTHLPFTDESHLRENALKMLCVSQDEIHRVVTLDSSGTTGTPKRIYFTHNEQELIIDFFKHGMSTLTFPGDRVMILLPCERPGSVGDLLARAVERLDAIPCRHGIVENTTETMGEISEAGSNIIVGIPVQLLALARFYDSDKNNLVCVDRILLSTDNTSPAFKEELEKIFGCEVFDHYGMTEMGLGGAIDCSAHSGYHMREADIFFEIIDADSGKTVTDGEYGEVVFTTLTREGMPFIRYRTGDISRFIPGECPCGSALRRLDYIQGRKNGTIYLYDGYILNIADLDDKLLGISGVLDFEASYFDDGIFSSLTLKVYVLKIFISESEIYNQLIKIAAIKHAVKNCRINLKIEVIKCDESFIPKTGKRKIKLQLI